MPETTKNGWTLVAFGDVVQLSGERSSDPIADGLKRYVGLEHIEPEDLRIRRWGDIVEGTTFTSVFRPGQVLFGKRRAYQHKVALADFVGVCSGDIYVFEPKNAHLLPELLPFVCQTEAFFSYAIRTSAGSLSPRTNWKSLARYEFALPPLKEQRKLADALMAAESYKQTLIKLQINSAYVEERMFRFLLSGMDRPEAERGYIEPFGLLPRDSPLTPISEVADVAYGISAAVAGNSDASIGWPILTGANITLAGQLDLTRLVYHPQPTKQSFVLQKGDVLLNWRSGSQEHVGKAALFQLEGCWTFASFILRARPGSRLNSQYLWRLLNYMRKNQLFGRSTSQQVNFKMNAAYFRAVEVPHPPKHIQDRIVDQLSPLWKAQALCESRLLETRNLAQAILTNTSEL